jgi:heme exporter protein D
MMELGKYAGFILPAYGLTIGFFVWATVASLLSSRRWRREAERLQAAKDKP